MQAELPSERARPSRISNCGGPTGAEQSVVMMAQHSGKLSSIPSILDTEQKSHKALLQALNCVLSKM